MNGVLALRTRFRENACSRWAYCMSWIATGRLGSNCLQWGSTKMVWELARWLYSVNIQYVKWNSYTAYLYSLTMSPARQYKHVATSSPAHWHEHVASLPPTCRHKHVESSSPAHWHEHVMLVSPLPGIFVGYQWQRLRISYFIENNLQIKLLNKWFLNYTLHWST